MDTQAIIRSRDDLARIVSLREKELKNLYLTASSLLDDIEQLKTKLARVEGLQRYRKMSYPGIPARMEADMEGKYMRVDDVLGALEQDD